MARRTRSAPKDDEARFLATYDAGRFERPSVAVDVALLSVADGALWMVLLHRGEHPHRGRYAIPGGFVGLRESLDGAAARVLSRKCTVGDVFLEQLYTFGDPEGSAHPGHQRGPRRPGGLRPPARGERRRRSAGPRATRGPMGRRDRRTRRSKADRRDDAPAGLRPRGHPRHGGEADPGQARLRADRLPAAAPALHAARAAAGPRDDPRATAEQGFVPSPDARLLASSRRPARASETSTTARRSSIGSHAGPRSERAEGEETTHGTDPKTGTGPSPAGPTPACTF